jgi:hypothetical protein
MATLPKVLSNQADTKSAGGVALHLRTQQQEGARPARNANVLDFLIRDFCRCRGYVATSVFKTPFQAILKELGKDVQIRFA